MTQFVEGFAIGSATICTTIVFEVLSFSSIQQLLQKKNGQSLYCRAWIQNIVNNLVLGPCIYKITVPYLCIYDKQLSLLIKYIQVLILISIHAIGYYFAHFAMHKPSMYCFHKLHHRFRNIVLPVAANCVSIVEYLIAYMFPFVIGMYVVNPDRRAMISAVFWVSFANILVHTPWLSSCSMYLPWFFCKTYDHLNHHSKLTVEYSAPIFSIDHIISKILK